MNSRLPMFSKTSEVYFFQFGDNDPHIPLERADEFFSAAKGPKEKKVYQSGHGLNDESTQDRMAWLKDKLGLK